MRWPEAIIELEREKEQVERETLHGLMLPKQEQVMKEAIHLSLQDSHKSRDNSTGFTIVWGTVGAGNGTWASFARSFSSVLSVTLGAWDSSNYSWGNNLNNSGFSHHSSGNSKYMAVGFT